MIKLSRAEPPEFFQSEEALHLRRDAQAFFSQPAAARAQIRFDFQRLLSRIYPHVRRALKAQFPAKCAYCETLLESPDIEAFRPKQRATNLDGKVGDDHYWWLAFEWSNYLPACRQCNALKGQRFPVKGARARVGAVDSELEAEHRLLLDPCQDEPTRVLLFLDDGRVTSDDDRGRISIDVLGLNRETLVAARRQDLASLLAIMGRGKPVERVMASIVDVLKDMTTADKPYAAMRRQYVKAWAIEASKASPRLGRLTAGFLGFETALASSLRARHREIAQASVGLTARTKSAESYSMAAKNVSDDYYRHARFVERFELRNIRGFERLELRASIGSGVSGAWLVLLGENGCGKSTVLQALACALVGQAGVDSQGIQATDLLRRGCSTGRVTVHVTGMSTPIVMTLARRGNRITVDPPEPKLMVLGYGATRLLTEKKGTPRRVARFKVSNLFDPYARLSDGRPWLYESAKPEFDRLVRSLSALLPRTDGAKFTRRAGRIQVETPGVKDTLDTLSSGYQAVLALALDIMSVMREGWQDMASAEGIVLIDEVDAHLHPRWKMRIVQRLREVFPRMQFIVTSHEPLTLRGLERDEVVVLRRSLSGTVGAVTADDPDFPSPKLMRVDQLLTSELFGLNSTEDLAIDALFEEYYRLLAARTRSPAEELRLSELRAQLDTGRQLGLTPRERLVFEAADEMIATSKANFDALPKARQRSAQERLKALWADVRLEPPTTGSLSVIHVDRIATPASIDGAASKGGLEKKQAIQAVKDGVAFEFKAYKGEDVVAALRTMFNKKCAYCEFNYAAGGPEDVEHFRPKGAVVINGAMAQPGYYWLAAEWSNLLPSCLDCNRKRTKKFANGTTAGSGKANLFPVQDESRRWRSHRGRNREQPLLLNPCDDDPERHLEFLAKGLVRPALDAAGQPSARGEASIEVYGLTRQDLVEQRETKQTRVRAAIERAREIAARIESIDDPSLRAFLDEQVKGLMREARTHLDRSQPFLAAVRAVFREFGLRP